MQGGLGATGCYNASESAASAKSRLEAVCPTPCNADRPSSGFNDNARFIESPDDA
jgi:hypothetical protein